MNDKELLQKIKNVRTAVKEIYGNVNTITYPIYMVDWLISQAEKVEQLEQEIEDLKLQKRPTYVTIEGTAEDVHKDLKKFIVENDELKQEVDRLKEQLQQAQAKAERYEKALKRIANHELFAETSFCDLEANELIYEAQEALEGEE